MRSSLVWMRSSLVWIRSSLLWMRSSLVWTRSSLVWMRSSLVMDEMYSKFFLRDRITEVHKNSWQIPRNAFPAISHFGFYDLYILRFPSYLSQAHSWNDNGITNFLSWPQKLSCLGQFLHHCLSFRNPFSTCTKTFFLSQIILFLSLRSETKFLLKIYSIPSWKLLNHFFSLFLRHLFQA